MKQPASDQFKMHLRRGRVYRREELLQWSNAVDRHLKTLINEGVLKKLRTGLYYCPRKFEFGEAPAEEHALVQAFLRSNRFVVTSPNVFNQLDLGTTQLYNKRVVYNQKRHGTFDLGGRTYVFHKRMNVPKRLTLEFLLVDLVNELDNLAEDSKVLMTRVQAKAAELDHRRLFRAVSLFGNCSTQKKFQEFLSHV